MAENGHSLSTSFYESGTGTQWKFVLSHYKKVLKLKADSKNKGGKELIKLDTWYQEQLPEIIQNRPQKHFVYDDLVKVMKWKLLRGKFRPRLTDLIKTNTPLAVMTATKRGFKRMPNLSQSIGALVTLKGVGPAMASAVLAAGAPDHAAFMSDEAMLSIPDTTSIDYTTSEYLNYSNNIQKCVDRLNSIDANGAWSPHKVEKTLWTYSLARQLDPSIIENMPAKDAKDCDIEASNVNGDDEEVSSSSDIQNGGEESSDAVTKSQNGDEETSEAVTKSQSGDESSEVVTKSQNGGDESPNKDQNGGKNISSSESDGKDKMADVVKTKLDRVEEIEQPPVKKQKV